MNEGLPCPPMLQFILPMIPIGDSSDIGWEGKPGNLVYFIF